MNLDYFLNDIINILQKLTTLGGSMDNEVIFGLIMNIGHLFCIACFLPVKKLLPTQI